MPTHSRLLRRLAVTGLLSGLLAIGLASTASANTSFSDSANPDNGHWCGFAVPLHYDLDHKAIAGSGALNACVNRQHYWFGEQIPNRSRQFVTFIIEGQFLKDFRYGKDRMKKIGSHDFGGGPNLSSSEHTTTVKGHFYYRDFFKGTVQTGSLTERLYGWWVGSHCSAWDPSFTTATIGCSA